MKRNLKTLKAVLEAKYEVIDTIIESMERDTLSEDFNSAEYNRYKGQRAAVYQIISMLEDKKYFEDIAAIYNIKEE